MPRIRYKAERVDDERREFLDDRERGVLKQAPELGPLRDRLVGLGGKWVILPVIEEDLKAIMERGELKTGRPLMRRGANCKCHFNSCCLWENNKDKLEIMTGYALSRDGVWRQHTWCWWKARKKVVETTETRVAYYGFRMTREEAEKFWDENAL